MGNMRPSVSTLTFALLDLLAFHAGEGHALVAPVGRSTAMRPVVVAGSRARRGAGRRARVLMMGEEASTPNMVQFVNRYAHHRNVARRASGAVGRRSIAPHRPRRSPPIH